MEPDDEIEENDEKFKKDKMNERFLDHIAKEMLKVS